MTPETETQANEANRLYWDSETSVGDIANQLGISRRGLYEAIEPKSAGLPCSECGSDMLFANRSALASGTARCPSCDQEAIVPGIRSERIKLTNVLTGAGTIEYLYDFGDSWEHRIKLEKVLPPMDMKLPVCVDGANAAPPDDCGGVPGYEEFVAAMADPNHPEHADMKAWIGRDWDPAAFDIEHVNSWLAEIRL